MTKGASFSAEDFRTHVFGQHLALDVISSSVWPHLRKKSPHKALVLSFNGWTGGGKTYVSKFLAESLCKRGFDSNYVHKFNQLRDFPDEKKVEMYKVTDVKKSKGSS